MLYAMLCYHSEDIVCAWSKEHDAEVMTKLIAVQDRLAQEGRLGPVARLMPTTAATSVRTHSEPAVVIDGPYAETKEALLGFFVIDCDDLEHALSIAREFGIANPGGGYEIRPLQFYAPGGPLA